MHEITPGASVLDSRDIIERLSELNDELQELNDAADEAQQVLDTIADGPEVDPSEMEQYENDVIEANDALKAWRDEYGEELKNLKAVDEDGRSAGCEWEYGAGLIHEDHWVDYVQELLTDIGDLPKDIPHYIVIDWESTADNIKVDYTEILFGDETYYVRS